MDPLHLAYILVAVGILFLWAEIFIPSGGIWFVLALCGLPGIAYQVWRRRRKREEGRRRGRIKSDDQRIIDITLDYSTCCREHSIGRGHIIGSQQSVRVRHRHEADQPKRD